MLVLKGESVVKTHHSGLTEGKWLLDAAVAIRGPFQYPKGGSNAWFAHLHLPNSYRGSESLNVLLITILWFHSFPWVVV